MEFDFEWDPKKAKSNKQKHRVSFEEAAAVFRDPEAVSIYDEEHSEPEDRWITLGLSEGGGVLVVCHTFDQVDPNTARIRIISSRKATRRETKQYMERTNL